MMQSNSGPRQTKRDVVRRDASRNLPIEVSAGQRPAGTTQAWLLGVVVLAAACATQSSQPPADASRREPSPPAAVAAAVPTESASSADVDRQWARHEQLATELEIELIQRVLPFWFPKVLDHKRGGFVQSFNHDGAPADDGSKFLVFQSRTLWVAAEVGARYPDLRHQYEQYIEHGLDLLEHRFWDSKAGGLFWELDAKGQAVTTEKHAYGIAFAIYGAARAARLIESAQPKELASRSYAWLDAHAHDPEHGGYFEALTAQGKPILSAVGGRKTDGIGTWYGRKSMNTHLHLLEAVTELYRLDPSPALRERLHELFLLMRDRVTDSRGFFHLYFNADWTPVPGPESYGHSVEGAYLMLEAARVLGLGADPETLRVTRLLVDHALEFGWDRESGGFFNEGEVSGQVTDSRKVWWVQAEGLNGLLAMHEHFADQTSTYWEAFEKQWGFIRDHVSDRAHGEWWGYLGPHGELLDPGQQKGNKWKASYHNARALMASVATLRGLAQK